MAASIVFQATDTDSGTISSSGSYTFAFAAVSSASGQERLVAVGGIGSTAAGCDYTAVTIDGQAATRVGTVSRGADDGGNTAAFITFYRAAGTASTSFNVVATSGSAGSTFAGFCALWNLNDADTLLATTNAAGNDPNVSTNTAAGGCAAAAFMAYSDATLTTTWSGLTERFDGVNVFGDDLFSGASSDIAGGSTPLTITANIAAGMTESVAAICVSFNPDGGAATTRGTPFGHRGTAFNGGRTFHGIINREAEWRQRPNSLLLATIRTFARASGRFFCSRAAWCTAKVLGLRITRLERTSRAQLPRALA